MHCRLKLALKTVIHCSILCFSFSLVVFFFCCNYTPLDGAARRRLCKTRTSPERKEASTVTKVTSSQVDPQRDGEGQAEVVGVARYDPTKKTSTQRCVRRKEVRI